MRNPGGSGTSLMNRKEKAAFERTALQDEITDNLRRAFAQRAEEDLPDKFRDLLARLREQEGGDAVQKGKGDAEG